LELIAPDHDALGCLAGETGMLAQMHRVFGMAALAQELRRRGGRLPDGVGVHFGGRAETDAQRVRLVQTQQRVGGQREFRLGDALWKLLAFLLREEMYGEEIRFGGSRGDSEFHEEARSLPRSAPIFKPDGNSWPDRFSPNLPIRTFKSRRRRS